MENFMLLIIISCQYFKSRQKTNQLNPFDVSAEKIQPAKASRNHVSNLSWKLSTHEMHLLHQLQELNIQEAVVKELLKNTFG
jgi:hypothetical protein